jgi:indolepyruvate ferredoxin oxidoreductase beta subunit
MQQIIVSGVGGQGVLFVTKLLAETALDLSCPVLISETHGMAQRGGNVISHLKVGDRREEDEPGGPLRAGRPGFVSPLIRPGTAEVLLCLHPEAFKVHGYFLSPRGQAFCNETPAGDKSQEMAVTRRCIDATGIATSLNSPITANLVLLGFAAASGRLFCTAEQVESVLRRLGGKRQEIGLRALEAGRIRPQESLTS